MGWLARMMGSDPAARLDKARKLMEVGRYNDARWELEDLEHPDARQLLAEACSALALLNLKEAQARQRVGDVEGVQVHLDLAHEFGATPDDMQQARRVMREARTQARLAAEAEQQAKEVVQAEVVQSDGGGDSLWSLPPDDPRVRYALLLENYPAVLRSRLVALGADFARAVLLIEDGRGAEAWDKLGAFLSEDPVVRYERARAAVGAGKLPAAASDLATFTDALGHHQIGKVHTGAMLAEVLFRLGRRQEALEVVEKALETDNKLVLAVTRAHLLEANGRLEEAGRAAEKLLRQAPRNLALHRLVARVCLARGDRMSAMQTLDNALTNICCESGRCGTQPFDVEGGRMLIRLYLEDRLEPKRAQELLDQLFRAVDKPNWTDHYLMALKARNEEDPEVEEMAGRLLSGLAPEDSRRAWVAEQLGQG